MGLFNKKELQQISTLQEQLADVTNENFLLKKQLEESGTLTKFEFNQQLEALKHQITAESKKLADIKWEIKKAQDQLAEEKKRLFDISEDLEMQEFSLYRPIYDCMNSQEYAEKIKLCRAQQKNMIKNKTALIYSDDWTLDGSKSKGRAMNNDNMKMVLRAYNNECDSIIDKVKFNNIDKINDQISKSALAINKMNERNRIIITPEYQRLKKEELQLVHEFRLKKQQEKEELKEARARERELAKLQKEIEEERKKIYKEKSHYETAREKYLIELAHAEDSDKQLILNKINEIDIHLSEVEKNLKDIDYRESNQRAGYVYIISNIGSFGENVYKIGMTRRLNPQDRVDELGDASVPFNFDVHAMIFSDDAPSLENELHKAFESKKINLVNGRREFFNVSLDEIKAEVKKHHEKLIEIKDYPDAEQYRESILIRKQLYPESVH